MNLKLFDSLKTRLYALLTIILIVTKYVELFSIYSISGFLITNVLFYTWAISTIYILYKYWTLRVTKIYLLTLLTSIILLSAFAGILAASVIFRILGFGTNKIFKLENDIVVQAAADPLGGYYVVIFENYGVFKKKLGHQKDSFATNSNRMLMIKNASSAKLIEKGNNFVSIDYYWKTDTLTINHKVRNHLTK